jgi:hypothetical protein
MMNDWTEQSNYTGKCAITRMVWNMGEDNDYSTWGSMRAVMALKQNRDEPFSSATITACAQDLLAGEFPVFDVGVSLNIYVRTWGNWDQFIRSWAEAQAGIADYDRADDEDEMAEMLEEGGYAYFKLDAVPGETVDEFNERLWQYEVEGMMDVLSDDFTDLEERLQVAMTMYLIRDTYDQHHAA